MRFTIFSLVYRRFAISVNAGPTCFLSTAWHAVQVCLTSSGLISSVVSLAADTDGLIADAVGFAAFELPDDAAFSFTNDELKVLNSATESLFPSGKLFNV